ncbi:beta-lactamase-like protein [Trichoderma austrokoningii]
MSALPKWRPGTLDIHHIDTGCGNATLIVGPDGTTIMIDCGTSNSQHQDSRPGELVARYALRNSPDTTLDYLIATHIHPDHVGDVHSDKSAMGNGFQRTGLSDVDHLMPARLVIDRAYPDYGLQPPPSAPFAANYLAWLDALRRDGRRVARIDVGSASQIRLRSPQEYPDFSVRTLAANGLVWAGAGPQRRALFPDLGSLPPEAVPDENKCSMAFLVSHGRFRYYTGGDLTCDTRDGRYPWMDIETPVAEVAGRVDVAVANHHGYFDACGPDFVRLLDATNYIVPAWHVTHPGMAQLQRMLGAWPGVRRSNVFATRMLPESRIINGRFVDDMCSRQGHVVVRVEPGGESYRIFVLDSDDEEDCVTAEFGPYIVAEVL